MERNLPLGGRVHRTNDQGGRLRYKKSYLDVIPKSKIKTNDERKKGVDGVVAHAVNPTTNKKFDL